MAMNLSTRSDSASPDPPSPRARTPSAHDTSAGSLSADEGAPRATTPGSSRRKNKRKMSEPRRLSDFSEKRARVEEDDSGVETTSAGSAADKSPVDEVDAPKLPGLAYPPIMVPYLPYPYPYMTPALTNLHAMHMINSVATAGGQQPQTAANANTSTAVASTSGAGAKTTKSRKSGEKARKTQASPLPFQDSAKSEAGGSSVGDDGQDRQYKTMTVERRVEANARERTRVHTISAAFEALRRAVPAYSYNQKLSKLAILRIACCYILSLSRLADKDYSRDQSRPSFGECVDLTTRTIQAEGRAKKRH